MIQGGEEDKERYPAQLFAELESEAVTALEIWDLVELTDIQESSSHRTHRPGYIMFEMITLAQTYFFFIFSLSNAHLLFIP